jgi:hypothetical protein
MFVREDDGPGAEANDEPFRRLLGEAIARAAEADPGTPLAVGEATTTGGERSQTNPEYGRRLARDSLPPCAESERPKLEATLLFLRRASGAGGMVAAAPTAVSTTNRGQPGVTVIVPVIGETGAAERTVASCLVPGLENAEVLVLDGSRERLGWWSAQSPQVRAMWVADPQANIACARNIGAQYAAAPLLRFPMPGDTLAPDVLAKQIRAMSGTR